MILCGALGCVALPPDRSAVPPGGKASPEVTTLPGITPSAEGEAQAVPMPPSTSLTLLSPAISNSPSSGPVWVRPRARWVAVSWPELPGWQSDALLGVWPALVKSCERPSAGWHLVCLAAQTLPPQTDEQARQWLQQHLQPFRVESLEGVPEGLITGYFEPLIEARRTPDAKFKVPLFSLPADVATRKPYWTRQQLETLPAAREGLRGREIAYVADPLDALVLQIQGSGRLNLTESDGTQRRIRVAFAGHNDQPYRSVGRWLIDQGELTSSQASWQAIRAWGQRNPHRVQEMLWANPRVVFFREEPLSDPLVGPRGAQSVPLTPGRSIAVDPQSIPYGTPVWIDTTEPLSKVPLRRLVMAQDTGSAITGAVRADYFWGWGDEAEQQAGRMKQSLRLWVLWPHTSMAEADSGAQKKTLLK